MDKQITLSGFESPEFHEFSFLESILEKMRDSVAGQGGNPDDLIYEKTENYTKVSFAGVTAFRLKLRGKSHYISVPTAFEDLIPDSFPLKKIKSDAEQKYTRIVLDETHPAEMYTDFLLKIAGETVNRYPKEWDCCSHYLACSDAKACVHPDKTFALKCGYRKILHSGRIFYGKNRNID